MDSPAFLKKQGKTSIGENSKDGLLPLKQGTSPGESTAESGTEHPLSRKDSSLLGKFVQRDRNTGSRCVAISIDIDVKSVGIPSQRMDRPTDNPLIGLVTDDMIDLFKRPICLREYALDAL
ncbi:MAG: hypothetical protein RR197_06770, partial [Oscillospiraceae bacterium]